MSNESPRTRRVRDVLAESVKIATGLPDAQPRPGQLLLIDDMTKASDPMGGHMAGVAPTGVGKSLASLAEAAVGVVDYGERWLMSTESISLQAQYADKDGPVIAAAAEKVLGKPVSVAILKGWSNHACALKAQHTAEQLGAPAQGDGLVGHGVRLRRVNLPDTVEVDGTEFGARDLQRLVSWALTAHADDHTPADKGAYTGAVTDQQWSTVSVSPAECVGEDCPAALYCKPMIARARAGEADIVITNHSMLAVQAATGAPVVIGNQHLGKFDGIIVDEAHTLPGIVRSQGQSEVSGRRIQQVSWKVRSALPSGVPAAAKWVEDGRALAEYLEGELASQLSGGAVAKVGESVDPLERTGDVVQQWLKAGQKLLTSHTGTGTFEKIKARRVGADIDQALSDLDKVREHRVGTARWFEPPQDRGHGRPFTSVQAAPVQVGRMIDRNLWHDQSTVPLSPEDEQQAAVPVPEGEDVGATVDAARPLTVCTISATLPDGFTRDAGLKAQPRHYPSPFDDAFKNSMVFIPRVVDAHDVDAVSSDRYGSQKFDTGKHQKWATQHIIDLVNANRGSALILSSTVSAGKAYAAALRAAAGGRWNIHSQWDGENARVLIGRWRDDISSVMVGTRSLMTGVDAPGATNTLVIVDRAPRSASNPVDDARVEAIAEAVGGDRWAADRMVYVSDAALLLEQAAGRLIRSQSDSGMIAVLDPRMLNAGPFRYQAQVRASYQKALEKFPHKTADSATALAWLRERAVRR